MVGNPDCVYVMLTCADGFLGGPMVISKTVRAISGKVIREGEIDAPYVEHLIAKMVTAWQTPRADGTPGVMAAHLPIASWRPIDPADIPDSLSDPLHPLRVYRNAARDTGEALTYDLDAAKTIALDHARAARAVAFKALDAEFSAALGKKDTAAADAIEAQRQALRDKPAVLTDAFKTATTIAEIDAILKS